MELEKFPIPEPSVVLVSAIVGFWFVLQQTPLEVTVPPPSTVIFPPVAAVDAVIVVTALVVKAGAMAKVLNETSFPYPVPVEFVA